MEPYKPTLIKEFSMARHNTVPHFEFDETVLDKAFDNTGSCKSLGDPYRDGEYDSQSHLTFKNQVQSNLFDHEGHLRDEARKWLEAFVSENKKTIAYNSVASALLVLDGFCRYTAHTPVIYYWR
jgi:hypothetical protein